MDTRFHCVYLLTSLDPQCEGEFYIGYTVNPLRRLRQHNGELVNGARRTSRRGRPWSIVCCVSGFTEDRVALKFEWCWQNPTVSTRLKHTVGVLKGLRRLPYAVGTLHFLVRAALFNQLDLTLHIFNPELLQEAQAKAEMFLATRAGVRPGRGKLPTTSSRQSFTTGAVSTQALNSPSAYGSAAVATNPSPLLLPPLEPSALFHVEVITRQRFEDVYLSHDRCLFLPSAGVGDHGGHVAAEREAEESCLSASCPYDVSVLSQAARAEWSNASANEDGDDAFDRGTRRLGLMHSATPSHTPSRDGTPEHLLDSRSEEKGEEGDAEAGARGLSPPPSTPSLSPRNAVRREGRTVTSSPSRLRTSSSPTPTGAADTAASPFRVPLYFAHYRDADFTADHADVQYRLHHGLLPCSLCALPLRPPCVVHCSRAPFCDLRCHLGCLAMWMLYEEEKGGRGHADGDDDSNNSSTRIAQPLTQQQQHMEGGASVRFCRLLPSQPCPCPLCGVSLQWGVLIKELKRRVVVEARLQAAQRRTRIEQRWQSRLAHLSGRRSAKERPQQQQQRRRLRTGGCASVGLAASPPPLAPEALGASFASPVPTTSGDKSSISSAVVQSIESADAAVELSAASPITATVPRADLSGLTLTPFCEEEWLM